MKYFLCCLLSLLPVSVLANDNCPNAAEADAKRTRIRGKADTPPEEGGQ
jgi:hypothetical protein